MRTGVFISTFLLCCFSVRAANVRIDLDAPGYKGERALLYRYLDLFTLRTELIGQATIDAQGEGRSGRQRFRHDEGHHPHRREQL